MKMEGKLETTYEFSCENCGEENMVLDGRDCVKCGMEAESYLRHFRLIPTPMKIGVLV